MAKRESLDFNKPLYAYQEFKFNGKAYKVGELFDWKRLAVSHRQVAMLYNARRLRHNVKGVRPQDDTDATVQQPDATVQQPDATVQQPAILVHTGAGWYNVEVEGLGAVNDDKLKGKEAAAEWATANGYVVAE